MNTVTHDTTRGIAVGVIGSVMLVVMALVATSTGDYQMPLSQVAAAVVGVGDPGDVLVVQQWRLPRVVMAVTLGASLGIGGAIFQSLTRNPLGSPDVIGFGTGSYTGALLVILIIGGGSLATSLGALAGGAATAVVVYLLSLKTGVRRSGASGFRLIVVGIGVAAMLSAFNTWLILRAEVEDAMRVAIWGAGSLNGITWTQVTPALSSVIVIALVTAALTPRLHVLEMGDDTAAALGIRVEITRLVLILIGIAAVAVVSSTAGPISFVALAAPQIARRLTHAAGVPIALAALVGAVLLSASDLIAQRIHPDTPLPVGVVTVCIGGAYLTWLLIHEGRKETR